MSIIYRLVYRLVACAFGGGGEEVYYAGVPYSERVGRLCDIVGGGGSLSLFNRRPPT